MVQVDSILKYTKLHRSKSWSTHSVVLSFPSMFCNVCEQSRQQRVKYAVCNGTRGHWYGQLGAEVVQLCLYIQCCLHVTYVYEVFHAPVLKWGGEEREGGGWGEREGERGREGGREGGRERREREEGG